MLLASWDLLSPAFFLRWLGAWDPRRGAPQERKQFVGGQTPQPPWSPLNTKGPHRKIMVLLSYMPAYPTAVLGKKSSSDNIRGMKGAGGFVKVTVMGPFVFSEWLCWCLWNYLTLVEMLRPSPTGWLGSLYSDRRTCVLISASTSVTQFLGQITYKEERLVWLMISEISFHGYFAQLLWTSGEQHIMVGEQDRERCSPCSRQGAA